MGCNAMKHFLPILLAVILLTSLLSCAGEGGTTSNHQESSLPGESSSAPSNANEKSSEPESIRDSEDTGTSTLSEESSDLESSLESASSEIVSDDDLLIRGLRNRAFQPVIPHEEPGDRTIFNAVRGNLLRSKS